MAVLQSMNPADLQKMMAAVAGAGLNLSEDNAKRKEDALQPTAPYHRGRSCAVFGSILDVGKNGKHASITTEWVGRP